MKLRALEIEQFRKFDRALWIAGMADGLNLIVGPNEMGKSTVFAALQAVLFERHRSQAQAVRSFEPAGHDGASPRIALSFEIDGRTYRIEKRFLRRASAELALPDGRRLHGEAAEEALEVLLAGGDGSDPGGGRRGAPQALDVWSLLWVGQGQSFGLPELAPGTRASLQAALEAELGEILGGDHGARVIRAVEQALYELVYKAQQAAFDALEHNLSDGGRANGREIDRVARDVITDAGHGDHYGHGLGHGIGLATHEMPSLGKTAPDTPLPSPTVFSVEPGTYLDGVTGVRIEDLVLYDASESRLQRLTMFPREITVVG